MLNITKLIIESLNDLYHSSPFIRATAASDTEHVEIALRDPNRFVRKEALSSPHVNADHLTTALQDPDFEVRLSAIKHDKAAAEHITQALKDKNIEVRANAIAHPNANINHFNIAKDDPASVVSMLANKKIEMHVNMEKLKQNGWLPK